MTRHEKLSTGWGGVKALLSGNPALVGVAFIGFAVSFQTLAHIATAHHLPGWPPLYPIGIDIGFLAMVTESRRAITSGRSDLVPRILAWALAAVTIYANAHGSPPRDWLGRSLHVVMPSLWIAGLELTRWRALAKKRSDERVDRIPLARWIASPLRTPGMARRKILHNVASYPVMVAREEARLLAADLAAAVYGRRWKRTAPALLRHHLRTGTLPDAVASACSMAMPGHAPAIAGPVEDWITSSRAAGVKAAVRARREESVIEHGTTTSPQRQASPRKARQRSAARRTTAPVAWRDKAAVAVADNEAVTAAELARICGVSKRTAERYLAALASGEIPRALGAVAAEG